MRFVTAATFLAAFVAAACSGEGRGETAPTTVVAIVAATTVQPTTTSMDVIDERDVTKPAYTVPQYTYVATEDWRNAVAASQTIDIRKIADHLGVDYYAALEALDQRGVYLCAGIRSDPTPVGVTEALTAAESELGADYASTAVELATLAVTFICPDLASVVLDFVAETGEAAPATTEPAALDQTLANLLAIADLRDGAATELRGALVDALDQGPLRLWERLNLVSGMIVDASEETERIPAGIYLVIDATSGYISEDIQEQLLFNAVHELATGVIWSDEAFGATTDEGNGAVGLDITADGKRYVLPGDRMLSVRDRRLIVEIAVRAAAVR